MGWNTLDVLREHPVLERLPLGPKGRHAYFVHSYHLNAANEADVLARADYGGPVTAIVGKDTAIGTQFHPEKSQRFGLGADLEFPEVEAVILFPAIDLKNGQCVRLEQGDMARATVFNLDPAAQAAAFAAQGFEYLHVVDLDGAFAGKPVNAQAVEAMLKAVTMPVQLGGGIRDLATVEAWLAKGITRVIIGTAAVRDPALVKGAAKTFPGRVAVGLDARDGKVAVEGWAETSQVTALEIAQRFEDAGVAAIIFTDIARDGLLKGLNLDATIALADASAIPVIASGGLRLDRRHQGDAGAARGKARRRHRGPRALRRPARSVGSAGADPQRARRGLGDGMFKVRVIPCLDVKDGRVVKGINFVNLRDAGDPVEAAIAYDAAGADELCFLDITATHENRGTMLDVVRRTAEACFMPLTVGGGVRTIDDIRTLLRSGADKVSINTAAVAAANSSRKPPKNSASSASWSRSTPSGSSAPAARTAGRSSPMAAANRPGSTPSNTPRKWCRSAPAKSC